MIFNTWMNDEDEYHSHSEMWLTVDYDEAPLLEYSSWTTDYDKDSIQVVKWFMRFIMRLDTNTVTFEDEQRTIGSSVQEKKDFVEREERKYVKKLYVNEEMPIDSPETVNADSEEQVEEDNSKERKELCDQAKQRKYSTRDDKTSNQYKEEIVHYKVPLVCWPKLHQEHKSVKRLIGYCHDIERKPEQQEAVHDLNIEHVDIFVVDKSFDMACLSINPEKFVHRKIERYLTDVMENVTEHFAGILIVSHGVKLVRSISDDTICTDRPNFNDNFADTQQKISNMIEIAIFKPLLKKVELLQSLQGEIAKDETQHVIRYKPETEKQYGHHISQESTTEKKTNHTDGSIRKDKNNIERLLGEMIALTRRSSLPESLRPVIGSFETRKLSKQVTKGLFEIDQTIKYCGYRYSTLHIKVESIPSLEEERRKKIKEFLSENGITDFRLDVIESQIKEYVCVGTEIHSEHQKKATLGCFSLYTKGKKKSICGLLSKHLLQGSSKIFVRDRIHFGTVLHNTNNDGGHDICAAEIVKQHTHNLDPRFRDFENNIKLAYVFDSGNIEILQDQPVYLRGAMTKLGVGTIQIPQLESRDYHEQSLLQLIDGNYTLGEPDGTLAVEGDSGAILCMDDLDSNKICLLSMLMGELLHVDDDEDGNEKKYMSLRLSSGLSYLEEKTQGKFSIESTLTDKESGGEC